MINVSTFRNIALYWATCWRYLLGRGPFLRAKFPWFLKISAPDTDMIFSSDRLLTRVNVRIYDEGIGEATKYHCRASGLEGPTAQPQLRQPHCNVGQNC